MIYGLIEQLILNADLRGFRFLLDTFKDIIIPIGALNDNHSRLLEVLEAAACTYFERLSLLFAVFILTKLTC